MREYELVVIVQPDLDENAFGEVVNRIKGWISEGGGQVSKVDVWGKRRMTYSIRKQNEGQYVLFNMSMEPATTAQLERNLRLLEPVMRFLITVK
ncbi:MAG: 30S ribosomal protein S6 [Anaerolineales bacterium]|nr:30S ribosomal protein S6 [Anaerolineales bacterium]